MRRIIAYTIFLFLPLVLWAQQPSLVAAPDGQSYPLDTVNGQVYYRYTVEKSIGLYRISKNFGVSQEAILQANPELRERGLRFEEVLLIPVPEGYKPQAEPSQVEIVEPTPQEAITPIHTAEAPIDTPVYKPEAAIEAPITVDTLYQEPVDTIPVQQDTFRIALLLPLHAQTVHRTLQQDRFFDFYSGVLLALRQHKGEYTDSLGTTHRCFYHLTVHDIEKSASTIDTLLINESLAGTDAIIGPAYAEQVSHLAPWVGARHIPTIIPFLSALPSQTANPYIWQFNPSDDIEINALMSHLDTLRSEINIVFVDAPSAELPLSIRTLRDSISRRHLPITHTTIRQIIADSIGPALVDSVENIILFHSERYSNIQLLMPYLLSGKGNRRLTLLSRYAWQDEHILLPQIYTGVFRNVDTEAQQGYEQVRNAYFTQAPVSRHPRYDCLGYDLTTFLLDRLPVLRYNSSDSASVTLPWQGVQSTIEFTAQPDGHYANTHIDILRH